MKPPHLSRFTFYILLLLTAVSATAQLVEIPDTNLRQAIRETLELPAEAPITRQEMLRLQQLHAPNKEITDLTGLEYAINLKSLRAWDNPISDPTPLANLTALTVLDLGGCQIVDLTPLKNLTQLTYLQLSGNQIVDISPLANLTQLEELKILDNPILDYSPLESLSIPRLIRDEPCVLPALPIEQRLQNRTFPSIFSAWDGLRVQNLPQLSKTEKLALHDLHWQRPYFQTKFSDIHEFLLSDDIEEAQNLRDELLALNPNMIFIVEIRIRDAWIGYYPDDFPYWLRDENGNIITTPSGRFLLTDFTHPGMQDIIVQQVGAVAECGLFDGIFLDWFAEHFAVLQGYYSFEEEQQAKDKILQRIRAAVRDDFLIIINTNRHKIPRRAWGINGTFMETLRDNQWDSPVDPNEDPYTHDGLIEIENTLLWSEENLKEPQINCLVGYSNPTKPLDSPNNLRFMRVFTTMSLTLSDSYVLYRMENTNTHFWYDFWNANLGYPVGPKAQQYQNIDSLFIREFTNGWAVYNRSGKPQTITLPRVSTGVSSKKQDITHLLPDLDGEIYLRKGKPFDLNRDGAVNVLDLIIVSQSFSTIEGDINGDGTTDILDLTLVAQQFGK